MTKKIWRFGVGALQVWFEFLAVILGIIVLALGIFLWRLSTGPLDMSFAAGYVRYALQDPVSGTSVAIDGATMEWPGMRGPLILELRDAALIRDNRRILNVGKVRLGLSAPHLIAGQLEPVSILLSRPSLQLIRKEGNKITLALDDHETTRDITAGVEEKNPLMNIIRGMMQPDGTLDSRSPLNHLKTLTIENASMIVEDHVLGVTWYLQQMDLVFAHTPSGLTMQALVKLPGGRNGASDLRLQAQ